MLISDYKTLANNTQYDKRVRKPLPERKPRHRTRRMHGLLWHKANANLWHTHYTDHLSAVCYRFDGAWMARMHFAGNSRGFPLRDKSTGNAKRFASLNDAARAAYDAMNDRDYIG